MVLFCEYVIEEPHREAFLAWAAARPELWLGGELMENAGQPGVFVEIWPAADEHEALRKQKERLEGRSEWSRMDAWVKGGSEGLRVWMFRPVIPGG
ncbi:hypothetical protein GE107_14460 [Cohnella sp. CFH 77786]|uniref:hypothetical protein n=1 Tax=Cohnella sp. CFH 77786 TaxID=2662265 RepID=UPI001C60CA9D|nr:hypothetical protein [Cohnella sp. CFH 77786]MBW5447255.1 hypothetical protein [Cohnella sp. CFH 77786]